MVLRALGSTIPKVPIHFLSHLGQLIDSYFMIKIFQGRCLLLYNCSTYATDVKNLLFLARLEFLCKTGCVRHYFQYQEVTFLFFSQNLRLKLLMIRFLTSVAYCVFIICTMSLLMLLGGSSRTCMIHSSLQVTIKTNLLAVTELNR